MSEIQDSEFKLPSVDRNAVLRDLESDGFEIDIMFVSLVGAARVAIGERLPDRLTIISRGNIDSQADENRTEKIQRVKELGFDPDDFKNLSVSLQNLGSLEFREDVGEDVDIIKKLKEKNYKLSEVLKILVDEASYRINIRKEDVDQDDQGFPVAEASPLPEKSEARVIQGVVKLGLDPHDRSGLVVNKRALLGLKSILADYKFKQDFDSES